MSLDGIRNERAVALSLISSEKDDGIKLVSLGFGFYYTWCLSLN